MGCSERVREALSSIPAIGNVDVNLETKIVTIKTKDPNSSVTREEVEKALAKYPKYKVSAFNEAGTKS